MTKKLKSFPKFMIPIPLLKKFGSQSFDTSTEISQMTRHTCKPNNLKNVNIISRGMKNVGLSKREINIVKNQTYRVCHKIWTKQNHLKLINLIKLSHAEVVTTGEGQR